MESSDFYPTSQFISINPSEIILIVATRLVPCCDLSCPTFVSPSLGVCSCCHVSCFVLYLLFLGRVSTDKHAKPVALAQNSRSLLITLEEM